MLSAHFGQLSAKLQKSEKPLTFHNWLFFNCGRLKVPVRFRFSHPNHANYFLQILHMKISIAIQKTFSFFCAYTPHDVANL